MKMGQPGQLKSSRSYPFSLSEDWNLISRTILPLIDQDDVPLSGMGESGIGDILQSFFFSPQKAHFKWMDIGEQVRYCSLPDRIR